MGNFREGVEMIQSSIQAVVLSDGAGADLGVQSVSIPAGFDRLAFSTPGQSVFMAFYESDLDNPYRRFPLTAAVSSLVIPNPKGLGTLFFKLDDSAGVLPDVVVSVMVL